MRIEETVELKKEKIEVYLFIKIYLKLQKRFTRTVQQIIWYTMINGYSVKKKWE